MKKTHNSIVLVIATMVFTCSTFGANTTGEEDLATFADPAGVGGDPGASPINEYLIPMLLLGCMLSYRLLKKRKTESVI